MANWKYRVELKDLHDKYAAGEFGVVEVAHALAERLKKLPPYPKDEELLEIVYRLEGFDDVNDVEDYDSCLRDLYDWGDDEVAPFGMWPRNRRCWLNSF